MPPAELLAQVVNNLQRGVALLSLSGQVLFANSAAHALFERSLLLTLAQGRLRMTPTALQSRLDQFLSSDHATSPTMGLHLNAGAKGALTLLVKHLDAGPHLPIGFLVFLFDHDSTTPNNPELLREFYELTPAEAKVAGLLYDGHSLKAIAAECDCSINTVRAHLKRIFRKCGVHSQAALVRLLALGPYWG